MRNGGLGLSILASVANQVEGLEALTAICLRGSQLLTQTENGSAGHSFPLRCKAHRCFSQHAGSSLQRCLQLHLERLLSFLLAELLRIYYSGYDLRLECGPPGWKNL